MKNYLQGSDAQTVSRAEYRRLDNRMTCIPQQSWPTNEISQWIGFLLGKPKAVACAKHLLASLDLLAIPPDVPNPYQDRTTP